jgi:hypothetical protein
MSVVPVRITSDINMAVDTSLSKNNNTTYFVQNTSTGAVAISQEQQPLLGAFLQVTAICASGQSITLANPSSPGTYAILFDFGATGGKANISCVANYGLAAAAVGSPYRWIGGAEISATLSIAGAALDIVQVNANPIDGTTLVFTNYTAANLPVAVVTMVQLSANLGF